MITIKHSGNFNRTDKFLRSVNLSNYLHIFERYGREGVTALASVTPVDTGETASKWGYTIKRSNRGMSISWTNSHMENGTPVVILLQYGHATGNGGYIQGRDFINPTIKPIFDRMSEELWKEITKL